MTVTELYPYNVLHQTPSVETYRHLRQAAGLSQKTLEAAARGLPNTLFGVLINFNGSPVAMGRVIGDGGTFYQVVDIAVLPAHQGKGLGKLIMREISGYIDREVPESGYVSLLADGQAFRLYQKYGFWLTAPASVGMALKKAQPTAGV
jgi:ribosomal protein S18 acetylase RimI-like enzyme